MTNTKELKPCPMANFSSTFGERVKFLRENAGESLQDVADAVGCTKSHVWEMEQERSSNPCLNIVIGFAKHFRVPASALVETDETAAFRRADQSPPPSDEVREDEFVKLVEEAMSYAWGDWVGDTGCIPCDFEWRGGNGKMSFTPSKWADNVARYIFRSKKLRAATQQPEVVTVDDLARQIVKIMEPYALHGRFLNHTAATVIAKALAKMGSGLKIVEG